MRKMWRVFIGEFGRWEVFEDLFPLPADLFGHKTRKRDVLGSFIAVIVIYFALIPVIDSQGFYTTTSGILIGKVVTLPDTSQVELLLGVPYATPPIGSLRFLPPRPFTPPSQNAIINATSFADSCIQFGEFSYYASTSDQIQHNRTSEDCLFLNIYIPFRKRSAQAFSKPIMLFIHGGGYVSGNGMFYDARHLSSRGDVIVVTINYRLGPLGFFATLDENAPGNVGLLDQNMAIQWVRENANRLGGDADK